MFISIFFLFSSLSSPFSSPPFLPFSPFFSSLFLSFPFSLFLPLFLFPFLFSFSLFFLPFSLPFPLFSFLSPFFPFPIFALLPDFWCPGGQSAPPAPPLATPLKGSLGFFWSYFCPFSRWQEEGVMCYGHLPLPPLPRFTKQIFPNLLSLEVSAKLNLQIISSSKMNFDIKFFSCT